MIQRILRFIVVNVFGFHWHEYGPYTHNNDGSQQRRCGTCGLIDITERTHIHSFSKWEQAQARNGFGSLTVQVRSCISCGFTEVLSFRA